MIKVSVFICAVLRLGIVLVVISPVQAGTPTQMQLISTATGTNNIARICPSLNDGKNITCVVHYGDSTVSGKMWTESHYSSPVCVENAYATSGYKPIYLYCIVDNMYFSDGGVTYVGENISSLSVTNSTDGNLIRMAIKAETLKVSFKNGSDAQIEIFNNKTETILFSKNTTSRSETFTVKPSDIGNTSGFYPIRATVSNPLSSSSAWIQIYLIEQLLGYMSNADIMPIMHMTDPINLSFALTSGSDITITTVIKSTTIVENIPGQLRNKDFTYALNETGSYTIYRTISNEAGELNDTFPITVQYPVNNITLKRVETKMKGETDILTFDMSADALFPMGNIFAIIEIEDNPGIFENISLTGLTPGQSVTHNITYSKAGYFRVNVTIHSEISRTMYNWTQIVENEIDLDIVYLKSVSIFAKSQPVGITIKDSNKAPLYNFKCVYNIEGKVYNEFIETLQYGISDTVTHVYNGVGNKTITVNCSNTLRHWVDTVIAEVYLIEWEACFSSAEMFSPMFKNATTPMKVYIADTVQITAKVEIKTTCLNSSRYYWWNLYDVNYTDSSKIKPSAFYSDSRNQPNSKTITFEKETIEEGLKKLVLQVNMTDVVGAVIEDFIYVDFVLSPIVASIKGGSGRTINEKEILVLDAISQSKDPVEKYALQPFQFSWQCFKTDVADQAKLEKNIVGFENGTESLSWPNCTLSLANLGTISIHPPNLVTDNNYMFVVTLSKVTTTSEGEVMLREDTAYQLVQVVNYPTLNAQIKCLLNCLKKASQEVPVSLEVTCESCESGTTYTWDVWRFNGSDYVSILIGNNTGKFVETRSTTLHALAVKTTNLIPGENIKVTCNVTFKSKTIFLSYNFPVNYRPRGGNCTVSPQTGFAGLTYFEFRCKDFLDEGARTILNDVADQNEALEFKIIQKRKTSQPNVFTNSILGVTQDPFFKSYLSIGDPDNDYHTTVVFRIVDQFHGVTEQSVSVQVKNSLKEGLTGNSSIPTAEDVDAFYNRVMEETAKTGSTEEFLKAAETVASVLTDFKIEKNDSFPDVDVKTMTSEWQGGLLDAKLENGTLTMQEYDTMLKDILQKSTNPFQKKAEEILSNLTTDMTEKIKESSASTFDLIEMSVNAFDNVLQNQEYVSPESIINAANALNHLSESFLNLSKTEARSEDWFSHGSKTIGDTQDSIYNLINNLVKTLIIDDIVNTSDAVLASVSTASSRLYVDYAAAMNRDLANEYSENGTITPEERTGLMFLKSRISALDFKEKQRVSEISSKFVSHALETLPKAVADLSCYGCKSVNEKSHLVVVTQTDSAEALIDINFTGTNISVALVPSDTDDKQILSVALLKGNIYNNDGSNTGALITSPVVKLTAVDESGNSVNVKTASIAQAVTKPEERVTIPQFTVDDASYFFYHSFMYRKRGDYVCIEITQVPPMLNEKYDVYIKKDKTPTLLDYDTKTVVEKTKDYMSCIPPQHFRETGIMHIGLKPTPVPGSGGFIYNNVNYTDPRLNPYSLQIITSGCETWNEKIESWSSNLCQMEWFPRTLKVICTCSGDEGLTFGDSFFVPPNSIDIASVFLKFSPKAQAGVLANFIFFLILYIIAMIWGRHQDKKDIVKWGVTPLIDNFADDSYYYLVTVYTGMRRGAGTRSKVGFIVAGEDRDSGVRELGDGVRKEFPTASVQHYLMATTETLGDLQYIYVFHDNSGEGDWGSWYLNRIDIEDLQDRTRYVFMCGRWLSVDDDDCKVSAVLPICGKENVTTFKNMFYMNYKENLVDHHMWISIYIRPESSHFTRIARITCLLLFVMLTMICNAMYFKPEDIYENPAMVRVGPFRFSWRTVYVSVISACISTPATVFVALMFKKAKPRNVDHDIRDSSLKYSVGIIDKHMDKFLTESKKLEQALVAKGVMNIDGTILPFWTTYIAWFLAIAGSLTSAFFLLLFSMEWGKTKTEMWLAEFWLSFFESILLLDPFKVFLMAALIPLIFSQLEKFKPTELDLDVVSRNYRERYGPSSITRIPAPPLDETLLEKAREKRLRELRMMASLKDVMITCVYLLIILILSYSNRDTNSFTLHNDICSRLLTPGGKGALQFTKVNDTAQYIDWLKQTALPAMFPEIGSDGQHLHWRHRQYVSGLDNLRLGPPRLRQLRVIPGETKLPAFGSQKTYPVYDLLEEETKNYCFGWKSPPCDLAAEAYSFSYRAWKFTDPGSIWGFPVKGIYRTYAGGGYIAELDVNLDFSNRTLNELIKDLWIDRATRAIFLEFTVYNAEVNLFAYCIFIAEFPEFGGVITAYSVSPLRIYQHLGPTGSFIIFCEVCFILFILFQIGRTIWNIYRHGLSSFGELWFVLDFIGIILSVIAIILYIIRFVFSEETLEKFKKDPKAFVNFQHIVLWDFFLVLVIGCLVFQGTLRLVVILGYGKSVKRLLKILGNCIWKVVWLGLMFFMMFVFFALLGFLLFGRTVDTYHTVYEAIATLLLSIIGRSHFKKMFEADPMLTQFYFTAYVLIIFSFMLLFMAIFLESMKTINQKTREDHSEDLVFFLMEKFKEMFFSKRNKLQNKNKGLGMDNKKPILLLQELRLDLANTFSKLDLGQERVITKSDSEKLDLEQECVIAKSEKTEEQMQSKKKNVKFQDN